MDSTTLNVLLVILLIVFFWGFIIWQNNRAMHKQITSVASQQSVIRNDERARELCRAIHLLQPGVHAGVDYAIGEGDTEHKPYLAEWYASTPRPTPEQLEAALREIEVSGNVAAGGYAALRRAEYPSVEEQLEAAFLARQGDDSMQGELDARIIQIKEKYPKEDECL